MSMDIIYAYVYFANRERERERERERVRENKLERSLRKVGYQRQKVERGEGMTLDRNDAFSVL